MARTVGISTDDLWIYLDDDVEEVVNGNGQVQEEPVIVVRALKLKSGEKPGDDGSFFRIVPTSFEMVLEAGFAMQGAGTKTKASRVMTQILTSSIADWVGVLKDGKQLAFSGPESIEELDSFTKNKLATWIYKNVFEKNDEAENVGKDSGPTPTEKPYSEDGTAGSETASHAISSEGTTKNHH